MKLRTLIATILIAIPISISATKYSGSISSSPSPLDLNKPVTISIETSDLGSDVYLFYWNATPNLYMESITWEEGLNSKYRMTGSKGKYSIYIANPVDFFSIPSNLIDKITKLGILARSTSDQTSDLFLEVETNLQVYNGGNGTETDPYLISTPEQLTTLSQTPAHWDANIWIKLTSDIDMGEFNGIGNTTNPYKGHFDGAYHVIKNINITTPKKFGTPVGFFNVTENADIKNLGIRNLNYHGTAFCGGLIGYSTAGNIRNCFSTGKIVTSAACNGGLIGCADKTIIKDCYSHASVTSSDGSAIGGLVGKNLGTIESCYTADGITGHNFIGGFVGANYGEIKYCVALNRSVSGATSRQYIGRFSGNISTDMDGLCYSWINMPTTTETGNGYHADNHNINFLSPDTYSDYLYWDFTNNWFWFTSPENESMPMLRGFANQSIPTNHPMFSKETTLDMISGNDIQINYNRSIRMIEITGTNDMTISNIYNSYGVLMSTFTGDQYDCSFLPGGIYIIQTLHNNSIFSSKLMIR